MDEKEILGKVADVLTQEPITVEVDVLYPSLIDRLLIKVKVRSKKRTFEIPPLTYAKGIRMAKLLVQIDAGVFLDTKNIMNTTYEVYASHGDKIARCIAIAVGDGRREPDGKLVKFFLDNLTPKEGAIILGKVISQTDISSFMSTIISMKGMSLLKQRETIAPGGSSAA